MNSNKPNPSKEPKKGADTTQAIWFAILAVSLVLNTYVLFHKKDKANQLLAQSGSQKFRWNDVSDQSKKVFQALDRSYYLTLKNEAERWAENLVLPKEAQTKGLSVDDFLKQEVEKKVTVSADEAAQRYVKAPAADFRPYPQVLKEIEEDIKQVRYAQIKKQLLEELYNKYKVSFHLKAPQSVNPADLIQESSRFPEYAPPPANGDVDFRGVVVKPPSAGASSAKAVIEVYSDFYCPFCGKMNEELKKIQQKFPDDVRVVFRHFPLPMHQGADYVAEAAVCAQEQGKFWEFHDRLWAFGQKITDENLAQAAAEIGLDAPRFDSCLRTNKYRSWVQDEIMEGRRRNVSRTPTLFINGRIAPGFIPAAAIEASINWFLKPEGVYPGARNAMQTMAPGNGQAPSMPRLDPSKTYALPEEWLKKGYSKGAPDAPVTIVQFMDYNCPFCKKGNENLSPVLEKYADKIRLVVKNFPLPMHPQAALVSEAHLCAGEQGKFWEYQQKMLGDYWMKNSASDLKGAAKSLGMDETAFASCLDSGKMKPRVSEDVSMASSIGVVATPTVFVNGKPVVGAKPAEAFEKEIDAILSKK